MRIFNELKAEGRLSLEEVIMKGGLVRLRPVIMTASVAALGFGDIPPAAFMQGLRFVQTGGWVAFNVKQTFLDHRETAELNQTIRDLVFTDYLEIHHLERYRHRLSINGEPINYYAIAGQKTATVPPELFGA